MLEVVIEELTYGIGTAIKQSARFAKFISWFPSLNKIKKLPDGEMDRYDDIKKADGKKEVEKVVESDVNRPNSDSDKINTSIKKEEVELAGHIIKWSEMSTKERNAFKHSYSRHQLELDLPNFKESNALYYQELFNKKVTEIRNMGRNEFFISEELLNGVVVQVHRTEPIIGGKKYFYYETINGKFISAGGMSE